jgi:hypothetical protein
MTATEQMQAAEEYKVLWQGLMPDEQAPDTDQFLLWAGQHQNEIVVRGINRAAAKTRKLRDTPQPMSRYDAMKYAASVMKNESLGIRRHGDAEKRHQESHTQGQKQVAA